MHEPRSDRPLSGHVSQPFGKHGGLHGEAWQKACRQARTTTVGALENVPQNGAAGIRSVAGCNAGCSAQVRRRAFAGPREEEQRRSGLCKSS